MASAAANTNGLAPLARAFFGGLCWALLVIVVLVLAAGIVTGVRNFGWAAAVLSVVAAVIAYVAHGAVVDYVPRCGPLARASTSASSATWCWLVAGLVLAMSQAQVANTRRGGEPRARLAARACRWC